ncbi:hypothetical protein QJS04_geneDACA012695 [Acorus gramineus]|uniref:Uncharacterized protein n=1 Tax=Acorus gramineus TaxID=55184 RepID=A0AAV9B3P9_ACOGR|nr:hypothetical protein QJS04_geneDACA012695 [Acorus gramineus]
MEWLDNEREHAGLHSWETLMTVYERALSRCHLVWFIQNTPQKSLPAHSLVTAVECILSF